MNCTPASPRRRPPAPRRPSRCRTLSAGPSTSGARRGFRQNRSACGFARKASMTELLYAATSPVFTVDGELAGELARDCLRLEISEGVEGLKSMRAHLIAAG